jgi:hypothetical protein
MKMTLREFNNLWAESGVCFEHFERFMFALELREYQLTGCELSSLA